jgi:ABC-type lipoprotein release transport system permease subunit
MKREIKKSTTNLAGLAFKNLGRHKVKTSITILAVALGIVFYLFMDGFILGMNSESRRNLVNYEFGAAKIYSKAYWENKDELPLYEGFGDYGKIVKKLNSKGYDAAPRAVFVGSLISPDEELPFVFIACDPEAEKKMFLYHNYIEKEGGGRFFKDSAFELILGVKGAKDLRVKAGDTVRLSTVIDKRVPGGEIRHINQAIDFIVAGIVNSPDPALNNYTAYMPISALQDESGILLEGNITELIVRKTGAREDELPGSFETPAAIKAKLGDTLPPSLIITSWLENAKDYIAASSGDIVQSVVFLGFFFVIVIMVIANTVLMSVLERTKEIGMLRALGMKDNSIVKLFLFETAFIGLIGATIGLVLFLPINYWMVNFGIDYSQMIADTGITNMGYRIIGIFKSAWNFPVMFGSIFAATAISSITAFFPSKRAVRMTITDALRMD